MRIVIGNVSDAVGADEFKTVVHAVERQVHEDFAPLWGMDAEIRLLGIKPTAKVNPEVNQADAVLYVGELEDDPDKVEKALGYHAKNHLGVPYGFVFVDIAKKVGEFWATTLSHEVLELLADPETNLFVAAPHPAKPNQVVLRPYEVCDPVQDDTYTIDGVHVSNFVTPLYFAELPKSTTTRTNYLNLALERYGVREGGYFSYYDIAEDQWHNVYGDAAAKEKAALKAPLGGARRQVRRQAMLRSR